MNYKTTRTDDWFTIEQIDNDTFAISEYKHWEETHCYLLCGSDRALLIDTGLGIANIRNAVEDLTTFPVMVATTHVHWDHIGGHRYFKDIAVFELEEQWLSGEFPMPLQAVKQNLTSRPCSFSSQKIFPAHHQAPLSADMIGQVERAFQELSDVGKLEQGNGIFDFGEFQIHI